MLTLSLANCSSQSSQFLWVWMDGGASGDTDFIVLPEKSIPAKMQRMSLAAILSHNTWTVPVALLVSAGLTLCCVVTPSVNHQPLHTQLSPGYLHKKLILFSQLPISFLRRLWPEFSLPGAHDRPWGHMETDTPLHGSPWSIRLPVGAASLGFTKNYSSQYKQIWVNKNKWVDQVHKSLICSKTSCV